MCQRMLSLRGDIDQITTGRIIDEIIAINMEDNSDLSPIHLFLQSDGGVAMDGYSLVDIIRWSSVPVYTYCNSYVSSSALDIYLMGEKRFVFPHSRIMIHRVKSSVDNLTLPELNIAVNNAQIIEDFGKDLLKERTNLTDDQIKQIYSTNTDFWCDYKTAIAYGIATDLI